MLTESDLKMNNVYSLKKLKKEENFEILKSDQELW